ncbi:MAG: hypothetical protein HZA50_18400 [Planctomycetes bacterium]|nr:hypothetical protein [Planctomycetota bacterium]
MAKNLDEISELAHDVKEGMEYGLFDDDVGQAMLRIWRAGVADQRIAGMIHQLVVNHRFRQLFSGTPFREPRLDNGQIILGLGLNHRLIKIHLRNFNAHTLMVGGTGAGKTTFSKFLSLQIAPIVRGLWLIDARKQEFRSLRHLLTRLNIDLTILPVRAMKINPLMVPDGVNPADWSPRLADMITEVLDLPPRASKLIQITTYKLYQRFNISKGSKYGPTLFDLYEEVKKDTAANPQATRRVWSKRYGRPITPEEAVEILVNVKKVAEAFIKTMRRPTE